MKTLTSKLFICTQSLNFAFLGKSFLFGTFFFTMVTDFSGHKVFVHGCAATPNYLLSVLADYGKKEKLKDVELIHIPTVGPATYTEPEYEGNT